MDSLLYTATSGASRVMKAQHVRSNNLSNADTAGFRADMERVQSMQMQGAGFDGRTMVVTNSAATRFDSGDLIKTGRSLDVAITGTGIGFIACRGLHRKETLAVNRYVQQGNMTVNGFPLMADGNPMTLPQYQDVEISDKGVVTVIPPGGGAEIEVGQLKLVKPAYTNLQKESDGLLHSRDGGEFPADATVTVAAEHLEGSNVSAIDELVNVMSLTRNFEMQVRMMKTAETLAQAGNRLISNR